MKTGYVITKDLQGNDTLVQRVHGETATDIEAKVAYLPKGNRRLEMTLPAHTNTNMPVKDLYCNYDDQSAMPQSTGVDVAEFFAHQTEDRI
jgi:hypothetical protein